MKQILIKVSLAVMTLALTSSTMAGVRDVYWHPTELTNTLVWLDASDTSTLWADTSGTVRATNAVARWDDKSGNSNHQLQATASARPVTGSRSISNINAIAFDGSDDWMQETSNAFGSVISNTVVFMVGWWDQSRYQGILQLDSSWVFYQRGKLSWEVNGTRNWGAGWAEWSASGLTNRASLHMLYDSPSENVCEAWTDGTLKLSKVSNGADSTSSGIRLVFTHTAMFDGLFAEVVIINGIVTTEERQLMEGYLAWKWEFVGRLPADHPYKKAAPNYHPGTVIRLY